MKKKLMTLLVLVVLMLIGTTMTVAAETTTLVADDIVDISALLKELGLEEIAKDGDLSLEEVEVDVDVDTTTTLKEVTAVRVFVNETEIHGTTAHLGEDGAAYILNYSDLYKIFPKDTEDTFFPTVMEATPLEGWAERFGYAYSLKDNKAYFEKESTPTPAPDNDEDKEPTPTPDVDEEKEEPSKPDDKDEVPPSKPDTDDEEEEFPTSPTPEVSGSGIVVYVNGTLVVFPDQQPVLVNDRTLVPVRFVAETLGFDVSWNAKDRFVTLKKGNEDMALYIGYTEYWKDGEFFQNDVAPLIINDRTMVPLRTIAESFGKNVEYERKGNIGFVYVNDKK